MNQSVQIAFMFKKKVYIPRCLLSSDAITRMVRKPTTNNETKDASNAGIEWSPYALLPLVSSFL
jgi:hypothetical protein